jgi:hypothetical protein
MPAEKATAATNKGCALNQAGLGGDGAEGVPGRIGDAADKAESVAQAARIL